MIGALFELVSRENIDRLSEQWAVESRNIVLLSGAPFSIETAIDFTYRVSKYLIGADAKLIRSKERDDVISFIIRHDGGEKYSYFCARCFPASIISSHLGKYWLTMTLPACILK